MDYKNISKYSLLSNVQILEHLKAGSIYINPFNHRNLSTASYDVRLGPNYFRLQKPDIGNEIYSMWDKDDIARVWGKPKSAELAEVAFKKIGKKIPKGIHPFDRVIFIPPKETFLCHTLEFIGGRGIVTTDMNARSSTGRNCIQVCHCAGWGDVDYVNIWTMEVTNNHTDFIVPLVVGRRIAQIGFFELDSTEGKSYTTEGKYNTSKDIDSVIKNWTPYSMLPKKYMDWEIELAKSEYKKLIDPDYYNNKIDI